MALLPLVQNEQEVSQCQQKAITESVNLRNNLAKKGNTVRPFKISGSWAPFFNSMLLSSDNFEWATKFLSSPAAAIISNNEGNVLLPIHSECTFKQNSCLIRLDNNNTPASGGGSLMGEESNKTRGVIIQEIEEMDGNRTKEGKMIAEKDKETPFKKRRATRKLAPIVES